MEDRSGLKRKASSLLHMLTALVMMAPELKEFRCPWIRRVSKAGYAYRYYLAVKWSKFPMYMTTWMSLKVFS